MKHTWSVVAAVIALSATGAMAQGQRMPAWNSSTVETFKGTITTDKDVGRAEMHIILVKTDGGNRTVVLGPKARLDPALAALAPPAEVEVTGSKVKGARGGDLYLASLVKAGGKDYKLRDEQGRMLGKDGQPPKKK